LKLQAPTDALMGALNSDTTLSTVQADIFSSSVTKLRSQYLALSHAHGAVT
jgi:hypothetical protein